MVSVLGKSKWSAKHAKFAKESPRLDYGSSGQAPFFVIASGRSCASMRSRHWQIHVRRREAIQCFVKHEVLVLPRRLAPRNDNCIIVPFAFFAYFTSFAELRRVLVSVRGVVNGYNLLTA